MTGVPARTRVQERVAALRARSHVVDTAVRLADKAKADRGSDLAAVVAYWSFFSLFPLMLVLVTVLAIALDGRPELQEDILDSFVSNIPIIGTQLAGDVNSLTGDPRTVIFGLLAGLWAGTKAVEALQRTMEVVWEVPVAERKTFIIRKAWAVVLLGVLGAGLLGATAVASLATVLADLEIIGRVASVGGSVLVNAGILVVLFLLTSPKGLSARRLLPGALLGGGALFLLQYLGVYFIQRVVVRASDTYGTFAVVIGLLTWLHLQSRIVVIAAELDAVLSGRGGAPGVPSDSDEHE